MFTDHEHPRWILCLVRKIQRLYLGRYEFDCLFYRGEGLQRLGLSDISRKVAQDELMQIELKTSGK